MKRLTEKASGLAPEAFSVLAKLTTPIAIQDFLDALPMNWEKGGETHRSPAAALQAEKAHCIEGALIAAAALWIHGEAPLVMDLWADEDRDGEDHVVALYRRGGYWGAISKTNHASIRFRDPVYRTLRELALSYFHEWFVNTTGEKTLVAYSRPLDLSRLGAGWVASAEPVWWLDDRLNALTHYSLVPKGARRHIRTADAMELKAGRLVEWEQSDPRT
ncbi:MAG: hypothetical protein KGI78_02070 [Patescibacteria group bacterium]|nr:hypothetical protein [Patescibacteria group bacterium]MDE1944424.1 hypothetical protein [Patescibacteria group bacterium]MDE1945109.1 hypothetical protein [Patescibacteria group bacterium]MDE2057619.1 hypothetical protein [Patescibacteria group bacterium]